MTTVRTEDANVASSLFIPRANGDAEVCDAEVCDADGAVTQRFRRIGASKI